MELIILSRIPQGSGRKQNRKADVTPMPQRKFITMDEARRVWEAKRNARLSLLYDYLPQPA